MAEAFIIAFEWHETGRLSRIIRQWPFVPRRGEHITMGKWAGTVRQVFYEEGSSGVHVRVVIR